MSSNDIPEGQLFTHVYCDRGIPINDSETFRRRIGRFCQDLTWDYNYEFGKYLIKETGLKFPYGNFYKIEDFFVSVELKYMLNAITLVWRFLDHDHEDSLYTQDLAEDWKLFVKRTLNEENLGYRLDDKCGVHYLIDEEFERNRISTVSCLQDSKYSAVLAAFEDSHRHLDSIPPDTKASVRSLFESIEILIKQMVSTDRLNKKAVTKLKDIAVLAYSDDKTAQKVVGHIFNGFANWVDGMHNYRHGQDIPEPVAPPMDLTVHIISSGTSFLRWLVEIDKRYSETKHTQNASG